MSDSVNDQHVRSMGVDPAVLGTVIPTGPSRFGCQACQKEKHAECWTMVEMEEVGHMADADAYAAMGRPCRCYKASETQHDEQRQRMLYPDRPAPTKQREGDQVLPTGDPNEADIQALVVLDITERLKVGIERYGQGLKPFNGRKTLLDAYEESLDQTVYLRSLLAMQDANREWLTAVVTKALDDEGIPGDLSHSGAEIMAEKAVNAILDAFAGPRQN